MLAAFSGHPFLAELALRDWAEQRGIDRSELTRLSGDDVTPERLEPLLAPSLFGGGGVIVDLAGVKPGKELMALLTGAAAPALVLDVTAPPTRAKVYEAHGELIRSPNPQRPGDVLGWLLPYAKSQGLRLEKDAAQYLADVFGTDLTGMAGELNKLSFLPAGTRLDEATVQAVVGREKAGDSFAMLDAATAGRPALALEQLGRLLRGGEDPFRLLGAVVWQYSLIARCVGLLADSGGRVNDNAAAQRLGAKPYPVKKALAVARRLNETRIRQHLGRVAQADLDLKRGHDPARVLERLMIELSR
ncbi:DNA polymerase III subunit delta [Deinococcus sp. Marseille-Q6407]|uniref:DNA polymerase III subunit delta n=1 Tax=Deinococcus sp. Marseille-Q6407 TaxID=2969223 RepID=UPI0021C0366A|nr:DNA polymerase III subunit delta [Deinococcus sp. Marseille-Q6407]